MATKAKAKAAPAAESEITVGSFVNFLGYAEAVAEADQVLTVGESYEVVDKTEGGFVVRFPNPTFNADEAEDDKTNPPTLESEVYANEIELAQDAAPAPAVTKVKAGKAAPAAKTAAKAAPAAEKPAAKVAAKTAAKPAAKEEVAEKPAAKKAAAKTAVAKVEEAQPEAANDELPTLTAEQENAEVLALVNESEDLVATAQELEGSIGATEYKIGGILYHLNKSKSYQDLNPLYKEKGGFAAFLTDYMNIDYRKAMHLIDIYVTFSLAGIENPAEVVARIGWTKASKLTSTMRAKPEAVDDLIALAQENTVADLVTSIKEQSERIGEDNREIVRKITLKFRYFEAEGQALVEIIQAAKAQQGYSSDEETLNFILTEWASTNTGTVAEVAEAPSQSAPVAAGKAQAKPTAKPKARVAAAA